MASNSKRTKSIRAKKATKAGRDRKRAQNKNGTPPSFAVHKDAKEA